MKIIISGPKGCGKSTVGKRIAEEIGVPFYETDEMIESMFADKHGTHKTCRMIAREFGEEHFREWETAAIEKIALLDWWWLLPVGVPCCCPPTGLYCAGIALLFY